MVSFQHILRKGAGYFAASEFYGAGSYGAIWKIAFPLVVLNASHTVMQFVDRKFLAMNSTQEVAAAFPAGILYYTLFCFYFVLLNFSSALVAQYHGAGQERECVRTVRSALWLGVVASLLIALVNPLIGELVIRHSGHDPAIEALEMDYFISLGPSGIFSCLAAPMFAWFSGHGRTGVVALVGTMACLLNIPLDLWLIFGVESLGIPPLGITGAGLATTLCMLVGFCMIGFLYLRAEKRVLGGAKVRFGSDLTVKLLRYGAPSGMQNFMDVGAFTLVTFAIGRMSPESLAASVIALAINNIFFMPLTGLADASAIVVGHEIGAGRRNTAEKAAYRGWRMAMVYMLFGFVLYVGFPQTLIEMFSPQNVSSMDFKEVARLSALVLAVASLFNFCDATKFMFAGALRGAGDTFAVLCINSGGSWLLLVPGVLLLISHGASFLAVWIFMTFYGLVEALVILWRFRTGRWRKIRLVGKKHASVAS